MSRVFGLIAEYNPFHKGHEYQLKKARDLGADAIIVAMSGNFTQRGIPAVMDKYERAEVALKCGADLVIELPLPGATSSAEHFARTGVGILSSLGVVDTLIFGAEDDRPEKFSELALALSDESFAFKKALSLALKSGENFAKARAIALAETTGSLNWDEFLTKPNNILGIEYVKALRFFKCEMDFIPIKRDFDFESSGKIRSNLRLFGAEAVKEELPEESFAALERLSEEKKLLFINNFSLLTHAALLKNEEYLGFLDATEDLSARTVKHRDAFLETKDFARRILKTKNITHTHVMRYLLHIMLDVTYSDFGILKSYHYAPYAHVLGVREDKKELLSRIATESKIPVFTSYKEAMELLDDKEKILYSKDLLSHDIYRAVLTKKSGTQIPGEKTRKFLVV